MGDELDQASCYFVLFICSIAAQAHGDISASFATPPLHVKQNKYANLKQIAYFPVFPYWLAMNWPVFLKRKIAICEITGLWCGGGSSSSMLLLVFCSLVLVYMEPAERTGPQLRAQK